MRSMSSITSAYNCSTLNPPKTSFGCNKTELSKYVWDLKRNNKEPHITWTIVCKVYGTPKRNFCRSCLKEKLLIIKFPNQDILLNKRSEFISKCRHENKNLIMNVK